MEKITFHLQYRRPETPHAQWIPVYLGRTQRHVVTKTIENARHELSLAKRRMRFWVLEYRIVKRTVTEEVVD